MNKRQRKKALRKKTKESMNDWYIDMLRKGMSDRKVTDKKTKQLNKAGFTPDKIRGQSITFMTMDEADYIAPRCDVSGLKPITWFNKRLK